MNDMIGDLTGAGHVLAALLDAPASASSSQVPRSSALTPPPPKFVRNFSAETGTTIGALRIAAVQTYSRQ